MFGLEDRFFFLRRRFQQSKVYGGEKIVKDSNTTGNSERRWVCFLPAAAYDNRSVRSRYTPSNGDNSIYKIPKNAVSPNPHETSNILWGIYQDAASEIESLKDSTEISVIGVSLGNVLAFKLADQYPTKDLISVTPGADLPLCIWDGIGTKEVIKQAKKDGRTLEDFETVLSTWSPMNNLNNITGEIEVHLGYWDKVIPYSNGVNLVERLRQAGKNLTVNTHPLFGHGSTIVRFKSPRL